MRRKLLRPRSIPQVVDHMVSDVESADRMTTQLTAMSGQGTASERRVMNVDLVVGENRINHGLGARARGAMVSPTVADAAFAWAFLIDNDRQIAITVIGVDQPGATIEVFR